MAEPFAGWTRILSMTLNPRIKCQLRGKAVMIVKTFGRGVAGLQKVIEFIGFNLPIQFWHYSTTKPISSTVAPTWPGSG